LQLISRVALLKHRVSHLQPTIIYASLRRFLEIGNDALFKTKAVPLVQSAFVVEGKINKHLQ
jgi:hypothetical protein